MRKIGEALRLRAAGLSTRKIAASLGVGQSTVSEYLKRAAQAGLSWPLPAEVTDSDLEARLFQPLGSPYPTQAQVDAFLAAGYTQQTVLEVILGTSLKVLSNYTTHVCKGR